jgi:hypothetical protein
MKSLTFVYGSRLLHILVNSFLVWTSLSLVIDSVALYTRTTRTLDKKPSQSECRILHSSSEIVLDEDSLSVK